MLQAHRLISPKHLLSNGGRIDQQVDTPAVEIGRTEYPANMLIAGLCCWSVLAGAPLPQHVVTLKQGDQFVVSLIGADADTLTVRHPLFGELRIPHAQVVSLASVLPTEASQEPPPEAASPPTEPPLPDRNAVPVVDAGGRSDTAGRPPETPRLPVVESKPNPYPWTGSIGAALTASKTATSTYNMRLSGSLKHKTPDSKTALSISYYLNSSAGEITDNDLLARGEHNWLRNKSDWELFTQATYQYDEFEAWAHRVSPYVGVGYHLVDEEDLKCTIKGGGGFTWEQEAGVVRPQALLEFETSWTINETQSLAGYSSIAPDVNNPADYLATIKWDYRIRLGKSSPLALSLGVRDIYDSMPGSGANHNDFKAWAGITLNF